MVQQNRKNEHIKLFRKLHRIKENDFDAIRFVHHSLPETGIDRIDLSTSVGPISLDQPIFINAMTGGSSETMWINEQLGIAARETGLPMATGSMSVVLKHPETIQSFRIIREVNPSGIIFANIGANHGLDDAKKVIEIVRANALQIHINAPQEIVMPEGDRDFSVWLRNIESIVRGVDIPVIVKEVGFGMSRESIQTLIDLGVSIIDISGRGGTNFILIENERRQHKHLDYLTDWGQSTVISLLEANAIDHNIDIISSGGIRNMLDVVKSLALGAKLVGISGRYLYHLLEEGIDPLIERINEDLNELRLMYALLGCPTWKDLQATDLVFEGNIQSWCDMRGIEYKHYANRAINRNKITP